MSQQYTNGSGCYLNTSDNQFTNFYKTKELNEVRGPFPPSWCGVCLKPIVNDSDSDLLEILTSDSICACGRCENGG